MNTKIHLKILFIISSKCISLLHQETLPCLENTVKVKVVYFKKQLTFAWLPADKQPAGVINVGKITVSNIKEIHYCIQHSAQIY